MLLCHGRRSEFKSHHLLRKKRVMNRKECYEILELPVGAGKEEIKKSYRALAMKWHPDRNKSPEAQDKMSKINTAYEILTRPSPQFSPFDLFGFNPFAGGFSMSNSSLTIDLESTADAEKIIEIIKNSGFKIRSYSIQTRG